MMARNFMAASIRSSSATPTVAVRPYDDWMSPVRHSWRVHVRPGVRVACSAMSRVAVVTDTTQYLPAEVIARHDVHLVSLYVNWDGRTARESELRDYDAYYDFLRSGGELPSTSQPSLGDFLKVYEPLVARGDDILSIHLSGGISGTVRAAEQARDVLIEGGMAPERMVVIDSLTGCAGHGFMSVAAANAVTDGADLAAAVQAARAMRENLKLIVMVDTLEYLRRGGRIGAARAWI